MCWSCKLFHGRAHHSPLQFLIVFLLVLGPQLITENFRWSQISMNLCSAFSTTWCLSPPLTWILRKSHLSILWKQSTIPGIMQVANCVGLILCSKKVYNLFRETWDNIFCISGYYEMSVMEMAIIFIQREEGIVSAWANQERHLTWWHLSWVLKIIIGYSRQSEI